MKARLFLYGICMMLVGLFVFDTEVSAQEMQEYTAHVSDPEFQGMIEESMSNIINARATSRSISWTVPSKRRYTTVYFGVSAGKYISLNLTLSKSAKAGIIDADGIVRYVTGTDIEHGFAITTTNSYCVFVQNLNSSSITAKGSYAWN